MRQRRPLLPQLLRQLEDQVRRGAPGRQRADEAHAQSSAPRPEAAVAVAAPPAAGDTPWDLPEVGGGDEDTAFDGW